MFIENFIQKEARAVPVPNFLTTNQKNSILEYSTEAMEDKLVCVYLNFFICANIWRGRLLKTNKIQQKPIWRTKKKYQQNPTKTNNKIQQKPTKSNKNQQKPTNSHNFQQKPTTNPPNKKTNKNKQKQTKTNKNIITATVRFFFKKKTAVFLS